MHLPYLRSRKQKTEKQIVAFRGVNYGESVRDGDLSESQNLTAERFPCMSPRAGRSTEGEYENATAVYFKGKRFVVDGTKLLYDGEEIATVSEGKKQFASVNSKVVIFPDKIMFDMEAGEVHSLGAEYTSEAGMLEFINGKEIAVHLGKYNATVVSSGNIGGTSPSSYSGIEETKRPFKKKLSSVSVNKETGAITFGSTSDCPYAENVSSGMLFVDASLGADGVKTWGRVTRVYGETRIPVGPGGTSTKVYHYGFDYDICGVQGADFEAFSGFEALGFRKGDAVEIEGLKTYEQYNGSYIIRDFGTHTTDGVELPTLIFDPDLFADTGVDAGAVTIRRKVPNLTVMCESNNRLWGAEGSTIFASALGDPTNFYTRDSLDTDSYAVPVASEGAFTGCCGFGNSVLFWKEDKLHKILGAYPSQYTMYEYNVPGVKLGSEQSLCNINEVVYYHGREGMYRYNGGSPELISENFGLRRYEEAAAGAIEGRYYLSMKDRQKGEWGLWVYDTLKNIWLREDDTHAMCFAANEGKLYCIGGSKLMCLNPDDSGEVFEWSATTARMDEMFHNRKCYSKLLLRGELLEDSAWLQVEISCDGEPFKRVYTSRDKSAKTLAIPIMPKRCDSFRVRLSGEGKFIIRSLVREFGIGSEY